MTTIIKFHAKWCGPCKEYNTVWEEAKNTFNNVHFIEKDIDDDFEAKGMLYAILGKHQIPTTLFINEDGETEIAKGPLKLSQIERRL